MYLCICECVCQRINKGPRIINYSNQLQMRERDRLIDSTV